MSSPTSDSADDLRASQIELAAHTTSATLERLRSLLDEHFPQPCSHYTALGIDAYRKLVEACQARLNREDCVARLVGEIRVALRRYAEEERFLCQTNLYLRATRPEVAQETESIGWHRETFYGPNMERSVNVWTPLKGVTPSNTLRFVPLSQRIPEHEIVTTQQDDPVTRKGSVGNVLGFLYAPKTIVSGVDFTRSAPLDVPNGHSAIFPGNLIHGNAANRSDRIRFSVDFRVIPFRFYDPLVNKQKHISSGKAYFEEY